MCDAFRMNTEWQFITGGQWVAHPGNDGVNYRVTNRPGQKPNHRGDQRFQRQQRAVLHARRSGGEGAGRRRIPVADGPHVPNGKFDMPVIWTKMYGKGKIFYNSLGHQASIVEAEPCLTLMHRGLVWAAK